MKPRVLKSKETVKEIIDHAQKELQARKELNARIYYEMFLSDPRRFEKKAKAAKRKYNLK